MGQKNRLLNARKSKSYNYKNEEINFERKQIINISIVPSIVSGIVCLILFVISVLNYIDPPSMRTGMLDPKGGMVMSTIGLIGSFIVLLHGFYKLKKIK